MKTEDVVGRILYEIENIQSIPSPTFHESNRAKYIFNAFLKRNLQSIEIDSVGNVIGFLPGLNSNAQIIVSAHLDTIHDLSIDHQIRKESTRWIAPGIGDNTTSLAIMLAIIDYFKEKPNLLAVGIWFVANVQEEGLGNLTGFKQIVDRYINNVRAYLVLEGIGLGTIYHRGLGVKRYQLEVQTKGGHAWGDFGKKSAVHELVNLMNKLLQLDLPKSPRYSFNFGEITGGVSINSIANYAQSKFEIRAVDKNQLVVIENKIKKIIGSNLDPEVVYSLKNIGERPFGEIDESHWLVQLAIESLVLLGVKPNLSIGSTDANYPLSLGFPAICVCLARGGNVHTVNEFIEPASINSGFMLVQNIIKLILKNELN